jgi:chromosome segregation ATPase
VTEVGSQLYLADTAAAAAAVSDFAAVLSDIAPQPRPAQLKAIADRLAEARDRAAAMAARLDAERLEDQRLENQREEAAAALAAAVAAMDALEDAARRGDREAAATASARFTAAVGELRSLSPAS